MNHFDRAVALDRCIAIKDDVDLIVIGLENGEEFDLMRTLAIVLRDMQDLADICAGLLRTTPDTQ